MLAAQGESQDARQALSELCAAYYHPVINFLRRDGRDEDSARELAHEFFAGILEKGSLGRPDPTRGRFRSYLLGALKHFVISQRAKAAREKRGGDFAHEPIDAVLNESHLAAVQRDAEFDREWALNLLSRAVAAVRADWETRGAAGQFDLLKPWLTGEGCDEGVQEAATEKLRMSPSAFRVAVHRLRHRFRQAVKAEIARTVGNRGEVEEEMRHLLEALS